MTSCNILFMLNGPLRTLLPLSYVDFLRINQKAPVEEMADTITITDSTPKIKQMAKTDRNFYEKGMKAFVSYVQSYTKHECRYLLRVKDLAFGGLAAGFGLLKIPHMPELKGADLTAFEEEEDVNLNEVDCLVDRLLSSYTPPPFLSFPFLSSPISSLFPFFFSSLRLFLFFSPPPFHFFSPPSVCLPHLVSFRSVIGTPERKNAARRS